MEKDIGKILSDALLDYYNEDYVSAHDKYEWFFENSEKIDPSMRGVRVSFCLGGWVDVAKEYPPAMKSIIQIKQDSLNRFNEKQSIEAFRDFACISRYLKTGNEVLDIFFQYHDSDKVLAKKIFRHVYEFLVVKEDWEICAMYMEEFSEKYDICFKVFDNTSRTEHKLEIEESDILYQDSIKRLKEGLFPLFRIMAINLDSNLFDENLEKIKKDLEIRDLNDVFTEIQYLAPKE